MRVLWFAPLPVAVIAAARGDGAGAAIEFDRNTSSDQQFDELVAGTADAVVTAMDNVIAWNEWAPGEDFRIIAQVERTTPLVLSAVPVVENCADLRGRRLLVDAPGNGFVVALRALLAKEGLDAGDYELVPAGGVTERLQALCEGKGDATILGPPFDLMAEQQGMKRLASVNAIWPEFPGQGLVVSMRRMSKLEPAVKAWLAALSGMIEWAKLHRSEAEAALTEAGLSPALAKAAVSNIPDTLRPDHAGVSLLLEHRRMLGMTGGSLNIRDLVEETLLSPALNL